MKIDKIAIIFRDMINLSWVLEERHIDKMRQTLPGVEIIRAADEAELLSKTQDADVLFAGGFSSPIRFCAQAKSLKWLHSSSAGVEGFMIPEIVSLDIKISRTNGVQEIPIAEHTLALILAFLRLFPVMFRQQQSKVWLPQHALDESLGKTVGIIGLGSIGQEIARRCKLLGMRVVATKRNPQACDWVDELYPDSELERLLAQSDFVVVVVPLTPKTRKLIGEKELRSMKRSAYLINIARGPIVDEEALIFALQTGMIAGAGLDVFDIEPLPAENPLWEMPNVIITPHIASSSPHNIDRTVNVFCENLRRASMDERLLCEVNKEFGY